ncbi:MAG: hypothetical protein LUH82_07050 [Clostridiales bacterium]|nr:hypothetical protein [Clostridiales bacterium]
MLNNIRDSDFFMVFKNFVGNEKIKEQISAMFEKGRLGHIIIIEGEDGLGKKTLAREIAAALVCRAESKDLPCGECAQCIKAQKGVHPDIYEYCPPGGARSFHIETIRHIINDVYMPPNEAQHKIYLLENAHCMNESAQNAALKIFEEPPEYAVFILTAKSKSMLLDTILSRAVTFTVYPVDYELGAKYITAANDAVSYDKALAAIKSQRGNLGRAVAEIADSKASYESDFVKKIVNSLVSNDEYFLLGEIAGCSERGQLISALRLFKAVLRDSLVSGGALVPALAPSAKLLSDNYTPARIVNLIAVTDELIEMADKNANSSLLATEVCLSLFRTVDR